MENEKAENEPALGRSQSTEKLGAVEFGARWLIARETIVTDLPGPFRLGYTILSPLEKDATGTFATADEAHALLKKTPRPLGWVVMKVNQLWAPNAVVSGRREDGNE